MKITKFGQCCLLVEIAGKRILTDPGRFTVSQNQLQNIDLILITHEHTDHLHSESITEIVKNNPEVKIVSNRSVGKILHNLVIRCLRMTLLMKSLALQLKLLMVSTQKSLRSSVK